ncbi:hypothetical protein AAVH_40343, partial [Aphelenchoides avenae]
MELSDVLSTLKDFQKRYAEVMKKGDARKLVTTFYHPHAVSVRRGAGASYGHDEITKFYEMCIKSCPTDCDDVE